LNTDGVHVLIEEAGKATEQLENSETSSTNSEGEQFNKES
jgi:hypothetical protein